MLNRKQNTVTILSSQYLDSISNEDVFNLGFTSFTYQRCKEQQLNLGLDLQGGMNVVLQVSMRDLIRSNDSIITPEHRPVACAPRGVALR